MISHITILQQILQQSAVHKNYAQLSILCAFFKGPKYFSNGLPYAIFFFLEHAGDLRINILRRRWVRIPKEQHRFRFFA